VDFSVNYCPVEDEVAKLTIWDTAGNVRYKSVISSYFRGAHGFFLIYDITNRESFENIGKWFKDIDEQGSRGANKILIGNKSDLEEDRQVSYEEGRLMAEKLGIKFFEVSTKNGENILFVAKLFAKEEVEKEKVRKGGVLHLNSQQKQEKQVKSNCSST